ncbi:calcium-transporting ATPase 8, plasma membrane-type isoform X2 [Lactuca sativa]|uniref:calcium-transporting ATPase 8, plasma membrane-type isoform X2 n=1 Tax=Lactuca sativa TaxID=4236 RepID=UPI0022AF8C54|nr:calcium-transporting ATPase 8, plasma membrane-type isoform X2 [Lactuca sativa]
MFVTMRERERERVCVCVCVCVCVIHLMISDQVPSYWIFISGYSLSIDESSMTGESHTVDLMVGCKVADGCSTMMAYICGKKNDPPNDTSALPPKIVSLLVESVAHNTTSSVFSPELGMNFDVVRSECSIIYASPFNSEKKQGGVAVKRIIVWKQSLYLLLSENSLCFMYFVIWIRKICFSSLTHVNKITFKCDLF